MICFWHAIKQPWPWHLKFFSLFVLSLSFRGGMVQTLHFLSSSGANVTSLSGTRPSSVFQHRLSCIFHSFSAVFLVSAFSVTSSCSDGSLQEFWNWNILRLFLWSAAPSSLLETIAGSSSPGVTELGCSTCVLETSLACNRMFCAANQPSVLILCLLFQYV